MTLLNKLIPKWIFEIYPVWRNYKCPHCYGVFQVKGITSENYECFWCEGVYMTEQTTEGKTK
jgi:hypothetical protein